jgi:hypothetical protein
MGIALCLALASLVVFFAPPASAGVQNIPGSGELRGVSMGAFSGDTTVDKASSAAFKVLSTAKVILNGLAVVFIVYLGLMMVIAYGDDGQLTKLKQQMIYILTAFLFINIPGQIYNIATAGRNTGARDVTGIPTGGDFSVSRTSGSNLFINFDLWNTTVENGVVAFLRILVIGFAVFYFTLAGSQNCQTTGAVWIFSAHISLNYSGLDISRLLWKYPTGTDTFCFYGQSCALFCRTSGNIFSHFGGLVLHHLSRG